MSKAVPIPRKGDVAPDYLVISPDYFRTMGIRLTKGRAFTERDDAKAAPVVIVSEATARHFWPGQDPVGQFVQVGGCGEREGLVRGGGRGRGCSSAQSRSHSTAGRLCPVCAGSVALHGLCRPDPDGSLSPRPRLWRARFIRWTKTNRSTTFEPWKKWFRFRCRRVGPRTALLGLFAFLALVLACVGIYGVMAYSVAQRAHEIGIRVALGADRNHVLGLVVRQTLGLCLAGLCAGVLLSLALTRFLSNLLYGVQATDMATFLGTSILLIFVALLASFLPAWRALQVDPIVALRAQ